MSKPKPKSTSSSSKGDTLFGSARPIEPTESTRPLSSDQVLSSGPKAPGSDSNQPAETGEVAVVEINVEYTDLASIQTLIARYEEILDELKAVNEYNKPPF